MGFAAWRLLWLGVVAAVALSVAPAQALASGRAILGALKPPLPGSDSFLIRASGPYQRPVRLYVEKLGTRGKPIVLLHGLGASSYSWRRVVPDLAKHSRIYAIDLKGHGRSDKPFDQAYAPTAQAELVRDVMRKLHLRNVTLVGHSYGGLVALIAALQTHRHRHPRISKLVLVSAPALPQETSPTVEFLQMPVLPYVALNLIPPQVPILLSFMSEAVGMGHITNNDIEIYAQPLLDAGAKHALIQTARQIEPPDAWRFVAGYRRVRQRTLLIWCRKDQAVPLSTGQRLTKILPRAKLKILDRCNHVPPEQRPRTMSRLISRFAR